MSEREFIVPELQLWLRLIVKHTINLHFFFYIYCLFSVDRCRAFQRYVLEMYEDHRFKHQTTLYTATERISSFKLCAA